MALRSSFAAVVVPLLAAGCADSTQSPANAAGASATAVSSGPAGSGGGGAKGSSIGEGVGGSLASAGGGGSGPSAAGRGGALGGQTGNGGATGSAVPGGAPSGGAGDGSTGTAGTGNTVGEYPSGWIKLDGVDYSMIPSPNFETVRLMFQGAPCSGSSCHFGGRNHLQVDKTADQLYSYMMSFKTLECGKLIDTANPSQSALVKYLRGPCGKIERMPSFKCFDDGDEQCVPEYYIQAIEQWIAKGAPR